MTPKFHSLVYFKENKNKLKNIDREIDIDITFPTGWYQLPKDTVNKLWKGDKLSGFQNFYFKFFRY